MEAGFTLLVVVDLVLARFALLLTDADREEEAFEVEETDFALDLGVGFLGVGFAELFGLALDTFGFVTEAIFTATAFECDSLGAIPGTVRVSCFSI